MNCNICDTNPSVNEDCILSGSDITCSTCKTKIYNPGPFECIYAGTQASGGYLYHIFKHKHIWVCPNCGGRFDMTHCSCGGLEVTEEFKVLKPVHKF